MRSHSVRVDQCDTAVAGLGSVDVVSSPWAAWNVCRARQGRGYGAASHPFGSERRLILQQYVARCSRAKHLGRGSRCRCEAMEKRGLRPAMLHGLRVRARATKWAPQAGRWTLGFLICHSSTHRVRSWHRRRGFYLCPHVCPSNPADYSDTASPQCCSLFPASAPNLQTESGRHHI